MEQQIRRIINEVHYDLEQACAEAGEPLCAESLADYICDRMHDESAEYRAMPYAKRRAFAVRICKEYV
jgi:hypothetical protein